MNLDVTGVTPPWATASPLTILSTAVPAHSPTPVLAAETGCSRGVSVSQVKPPSTPTERRARNETDDGASRRRRFLAFWRGRKSPPSRNLGLKGQHIDCP